MENNTRLKMHIKGNLSGSIYNVFHKYHARRHGVKTHSIMYHSNGHIEMDLEGNKKALWALVNKNRRGPVFCTVEELQIQFI